MWNTWLGLFNKLLVDNKCLPNEIIGDNEVIAVEENSGNVTAEEDHDNTHEDKCQVDLTFYRVPCSVMGKPETKHYQLGFIGHSTVLDASEH